MAKRTCETTNGNLETAGGPSANNMRPSVLKILAIYSTAIIMGLSNPLLGTTYVHLERLFQADAQTISLAMAISNGGYLLGAVVCALLYDRGRPELLFALANLTGVAASVVAAYARNFVVFVAAMVVHEAAFGFDDAAGQSYCIGLLKNSRLQGPLLQGMHAAWSLAGIVGPMVIKLFLCELTTSVQASNESLKIENASGNLTGLNLNGCSSGGESVASTRMAFLTLGVIAFVGNLPFVALCFKGMKFSIGSKSTKTSKVKVEAGACVSQELLEISPPSEMTKPAVDINEKRTNRSTTFKAIHVIFISIFCMLNSEFVPVLFLVLFAMKHLGWSVMHSSLLLSVYFGAQFAGRVVGILKSLWLSPVKMLSFNLALTTTAHLLLLAVNRWPSVAWVGAALAGFGVSTTFPTTILWISETTPLTGKLGAVVIVASCFSTISFPYVASTLFSTLSQMWFVYILLIVSSTHLFVLILGAFFVKKFS